MRLNKFTSISFISLAIFFVAFSVYGAQANIKPRILIVPGHEPTYGGAEFGKIKERDLAVELSQYLKEFLESNDEYKVYITRDEKTWKRSFADYFKNNGEAINSWQKQAKKDIAHSVSIGSTTLSEPLLIHNDTETDVGMRLYGITKWSNDNAIDLMIHVHLNDDPVHKRKVPGNFSGFAIYVPDKVYSNSRTSYAIAESLFRRLAEYNPISNLKQETDGIIFDPGLIALGAYNTSKSPSLLIEYDYIYAPQITELSTRSLALRDLAYQTYLGLQDFYGKNTYVASRSHSSSILPYLWLEPVTNKSKPADIYALQTALTVAGEYPPSNKKKNDCPRSGLFGSCTRLALKNFQKNQGIKDEEGIAGEKTLEILHDKF